MDMIELNKVSVQYGEKEVLSTIDLSIKQGEFFVLVGKSGSGKTTLLKMLNRLIEPIKGVIYRQGMPLNDIPLRELRLDTGYVLQQATLFPNLTILENIELIPEMKKWSKEKRKQEAYQLLDKVGLEAHTFASRMPHELSGGQQQRVGILRALITQPSVLLLDEPFSALDPISKKQLQEMIKALHKEFQVTIVFVTHDMDEAIQLGDRICVMKDGNILQVDEPQYILSRPATKDVEELFKGEHYE